MSPSRARLLWWTTFVGGLGLSVFMASRSQVGGDQQLLLDLGWHFMKGDWLPYGMPTSAGGRSPGGLMGLIIGAPMSLWPDYRAPILLTIFLHAAAFLLLVQTLGRGVTSEGRWLLLIFLWLNPWRMYFSAHLWNANLMFPIGVVHLVTAWSMRSRPVAWATFLHAAAVGLAFQVHTSFAILAILSLVLFATRMIRVHWAGFVAAVVLCAAALLPWVLAIVESPDLLPGNKGFPFRGILFVFPLLRGLLYWLRYGSLAVSGGMTHFDFDDLLGELGGAVVGSVASGVAFLANVTLLLPICANWFFARRIGKRRPWRLPPTDRKREWFWRAVVATLAAALVAFAVSPTEVMFWQGFVIFQAPVLVVVFFVEALLRTAWRDATLKMLWAWAGLLAVLLVALSLGAPLYRCGGLDHSLAGSATAVPLGVQTHCDPE